jgi:hypothetical protein
VAVNIARLPCDAPAKSARCPLTRTNQAHALPPAGRVWRRYGPRDERVDIRIVGLPARLSPETPLPHLLTTGPTYWTYLLELRTGPTYWTYLLDLPTGPTYWTYLLDLPYWTSLLELPTGPTYWTYLLDLTYWTYLLDLPTGPTYLNYLLDPTYWTYLPELTYLN